MSLNDEINFLIQLFNQGSYNEVIEKGKIVLSKFKKFFCTINLIVRLQIKNLLNWPSYYKKAISYNSNYFRLL